MSSTSEERKCDSEESSSVEEKDIFFEEYHYLDLVRKIMETGCSRPDRTGVGNISVFGEQMRFTLKGGLIPVLTTKRVFWRGVVEELLWFIKGSTNSKELSEKGVKIWDANSTREYLDSIGFKDRMEGDLGPVYGFQWRHFGAKYINMNADYFGQGIDQLKNVINLIKENPYDRRMLMVAWNPIDIKLMALPPCHCLVQFYTANGELSCQLYQRSADMGLGVPFNIASYALLTHMVAHVTKLKPKEFIHVLGDAHIYENHITALKTQLNRMPRAEPRISFARELDDITEFKSSDIILTGYNPHPKIPMEMAV